MKRQTLILIIIFSILAIDLPFMMAYQSSVFSFQFENYEQANTLNYLRNKGPLIVEYSEKEISHLEDVKRVMGYANFYFMFLLVVEVFLLVMIFRTDRKEFHKAFLYGGLTSLAVLFLTLIWALTDFNSLFTAFHNAFFETGTWTFASTDKLVNLFTHDFFYQTAKEIFIKSIIFSFILTFIGFAVRFRDLNKKELL